MLDTDVFDLDADNPFTYVQPSSSKLATMLYNGFGAGKPNRGAITTPFVWCIEFGLKAWHYLVPALQTVEPDQL